VDDEWGTAGEIKSLLEEAGLMSKDYPN